MFMPSEIEIIIVSLGARLPVAPPPRGESKFNSKGTRRAAVKKRTEREEMRHS